MKIIIFSMVLACVCSSKLNVPKLLLPYFSNVATNFTLEVSEGCFQWRSTRPEIAAIQPDTDTGNGHDCSETAVVVVTSRVPSRKTAVIIAEDRVSGAQLRCDVIVDVIHAIAIETTTHELYLDDSPEEFVIRASNEEGDVFSSVDGLVFEWNLLPDTEFGQNLTPATNILKFKPYAESNYEALPYIESLEDDGLRGDRVLVKGVRTGSAKVGVRPADPAFKKIVNEATVRIIVMANIQLIPPVVYLLPLTTVHYRVEQIRNNQATEIQMPSNQYYLEIKDGVIAEVEEKTSVATALQLGDTEVVLKDRNIYVPGMFREPTAGIYVVTPAYLEFSVTGGNWVLETDRIYEITIHICDKEGHKIFPSDNIRIEATFPSKYFEVHHSSANGSHHVVKTLLRGFTEIDGLFETVIRQDGSRHTFKPAIQNSQEVEIYDPVHVTPKRVVLPWLPQNMHMHNMFQLQATGGSGNYTWSSSLPEVATVTVSGQVVTSRLTGETVVKAADTKNHAHFDTMRTLVLPPGEMEFLPSVVEAELGTTLTLPLAVYAKREKKAKERLEFAECHLMPFDVKVKDAAIFIAEQEALPPEVSKSCAGIQVKAKTQGHTEVIVTYNSLEARVTIAAYKPLKAVDPEEMTLVTKASSRDMLFEGGPQPWVLDPIQFYERLDAETAWDVQIDLVKTAGQKSTHLFRVLCKQYGEQTLTIEVGNGVTRKNQFPAVSKASVKFACAEPRSMRLIPLVKQPSELCPVNPEFDDPVPVHSYRDLDLQLVVKDAEGRRFDNFSSLAFDWTLSDQSLASFAPGQSTIVTKSSRLNIISYRSLSMKNQLGSLDVTTQSHSYDSAYFTLAGVGSDYLQLSSPLTDTRTLSLVEDGTIEPPSITLYIHDTNRASMHIAQGSGHFQVVHANANQATVQHDKSRSIGLVPRAEGEFKLTANDLCLEPRKPATGKVFVSDVHSIVLTVVDKVQIHKEIEAQVQVLDKRGSPIPVKYFDSLGLKPEIGHKFITLTPKTDKPAPGDDVAIYTVRGIALGRTPLQFIATQQFGSHVMSDSQEIQVFPPLRLEPRNITMIIGAIFEVIANGGPQPQSTIEFAIKNEKIGRVSNTGLIDAVELGTTTIIGRAVGLNADNTRVVYSLDEVTLNVVQLVGIKIFAPLKRLQTDTQMPLYAMGLGENETPFTFGSAVPPLQFHWTISNSDVANLKPLFYKSGITPTPGNDFAVRLLAYEPGHVTVTLRVTSATGSRLQIKNSKQLMDTVQIKVFEKLRVINPDVCDGTLLITPSTETKIKTNRDGSSAHLTYTVQSDDAKATPVVTVDTYGTLVAGSNNGLASILITSHEENGVNQSAVIAIKVRAVSYLMLNSDTVLHTSHGHDDIERVPLGTSLTLSVSFHDSEGEMFDATSSKIGFRENRKDLLQIWHSGENDTLVAKATNIGQTVLKVWDRERPALADYVLIDVGYAISPSAAKLTLGDVVCLSSPLVTENGYPGTWLTSSGVVTVEEQLGIALATKVGTTDLSYNVSNGVATHTKVTVTPISAVSITSEGNDYLTNVEQPFPDLMFPIQLKDAQNSAITSHIYGNNCSEVLVEKSYVVGKLPVRCEASLSINNPHVHIEQIVTVTTEFDVLRGVYRCRIKQLNTGSLSGLVSQLDSSIQLRAIVVANEGQGQVSSAQLSLPYIPQFHVQTSQVLLSNEVYVTKLRVSAVDRVLAGLKVVAVDESLVAVEAPEKEHHSSAVSYPIRLQLSSSLWDRSQLETSIEITCTLTGHVLTLPVKVQLVGSKEAQQKLAMTWRDVLINLQNTDYYQLLFLLLALIATVACLVIAYHVMLGGRYTAASQQSGVFVPQGGSSPQQQQLNYSGMASPWNQTLNTSGSPPRLWSVDYGPYETSGIFKRSPVPQSPRS